MLLRESLVFRMSQSDCGERLCDWLMDHVVFVKYAWIYCMTNGETL